MKISARHLGVMMSLALFASFAPFAPFATGCASAPQAPKTPSEVVSATHAELAHTIEPAPAAVEEWRSVSLLLEPGLDAKLMDSSNPYEKNLDAPEKEALVPMRTWGTGMPAKIIAPALPEMLENRE